MVKNKVNKKMKDEKKKKMTVSLRKKRKKRKTHEQIMRDRGGNKEETKEDKAE